MYKKISSLTVIVCFFLTTLGPLPKAHADTLLDLPTPGTMVNLSPAYEPALIKGLTVHKDNPFLFDFIVDTGNSGIAGDELKKEGDRLVKYFFACLTIPEKDLWVNLSPYEKNRMVPDALGQTALGRDLLAEDYILKQLTASLIYPEKDLGKAFWDRVYAKARQMYGTTQIPVNTFNKVWILADKANVYEHGQTAFVVSGHLKVMLEEDYLALQRHTGAANPASSVNMSNATTGALGKEKAHTSLATKQSHTIGSQIIREIVLPEIEKEVNTGKNFSTLRQIFNSLILASWYKNNLKEALLTQIYANKSTVKGVNLADPSVKEQIYQQYLKAYKKGVFNYIKEDAQPDGQTIPRKYFSGGFASALNENVSRSPAMAAEVHLTDAYTMQTALGLNRTDAAMNMVNVVPGDKAQLTDKYPVGVAYGKHKDKEIPTLSAADLKNLRAIVGGKGFGLFDMSSPETIAAFKEFLKSPASQERIKEYLQKVITGNPQLLNILLAKLGDTNYLEETELRVPAGFTITTEQTGNWDVLMKQGPEAVNKELKKLKDFLSTQGISIEGIDDDLLNGITADQAKKFFDYLSSVENTFGKKLGAESGMPLLIAVRSGARLSMPGMMDTILNLGLNDESVKALIEATNPKFAWDSYRRFIEMFGRTVLGIEEDEKRRTGFKYILEDMIHQKEIQTGKKDLTEYDLDAADYQDLVTLYKKELVDQSKPDRPMVVPQNPRLQYLMAIQTVMRSTFNNRALEYRRREGLRVEDTLSAVNIVPMVFGNRNDESGSGVFFTRDLRTGERRFNLEFAFNAQGEDVVSGRKAGQSLEVMLADPKSQDVALQLLLIGSFLESKYGNVQDIEFTFEYDDQSKKNLLYILQTRNAKRTAMADVRTAVEMAQEQMEKERANGTLTEERESQIKAAAVNSIGASALGDLLVDRFDPKEKENAIKEGRLISQTGLNASPGAGVGKIVLDAETAQAWHDHGEKVILVREETSPEDLGGMLASEAILTTKGGRTSHAAVVARQFGIPAVVSITNMKIDFNRRTVTFLIQNPDKTTSELVIKEGDYLAVDGTGEGENGQVFKEGIASKQAFSDAHLNADLIWGELIGNNGNGYIDPNGNFLAKFGELKNYSDMDLPDTTDAQKKQIYDILKRAQEIPMIPSIITTMQNKEEGISILEGMIHQLEAWISLLGNSAHDINLRKEYVKYIDSYHKYINEYQQKILSEDEESFYQQYKQLKQWANDIRKIKKALGVGANAEEPLDVLNAVLNGAERIGLVRTEHMFKGDRLLVVQKMMVSEGPEREKALAELLPSQQSDFEQIFLLLKDRPATIRLIDPPLHEFLPKNDQDFERLARYMLGMNPDLKIELSISDRNKVQDLIKDLRVKVDGYKEDNPMIGTRGVRLSVLIPEIIEMQARAIFNAMQRVKSLGITVKPEIMVPLVGNVEEFKFVRDRIVGVAEGQGINRKEYKVGTMIEIIAGAENAVAIAKEAEFFSFGTNDLTQTGLALSRDDGKEFLEVARLTGVFEADPFVSLIKDVAKFMERATLPVRAALAERIKDTAFSFGVCGEQGVDVQSISEYLIKYLDYVSGNANRVPGAIFIGAQLALAGKTRIAGAAKEEPRIEMKTYGRVNSIGGEIREQIESAVRFVKSRNNSLPAKKIALAQIKFPETPQEFERLLQDGEFINGDDFQTVWKWAQELKREPAQPKDGTRMAVKVKTDFVPSDETDVSELKEVSDGIGIVATDRILKTNINVRSTIQEYLLLMAGSARDENKEQQILLELRRYFRKAMNNILGEGTGLQTNISVRLPSISLHSFFEYDTKETEEAAIAKLAQQLGLTNREVHERIEKYKESNPDIGERGSRVFFKKVAPFYITLAQTMIIAAQENHYSMVNLILPFINNGKQILVIRNGYKDGEGNVIVPSLNEAVQSTVNEIDGGVTDDKKIHVRIGAVIETPSATMDAKEISQQVEGPIFIDVDNLTMTVWAAVARDVSRPTGFRDDYLKLGLWKKDIFRFAPPDVRNLVIEAIRNISSIPGREVSLIGGNVLDLELLEAAQYAGADSIVFPYDASNPKSIQLGAIVAAAAAARVNVPHDRAMNANAPMQVMDFLDTPQEEWRKILNRMNDGELYTLERKLIHLIPNTVDARKKLDRANEMIKERRSTMRSTDRAALANPAKNPLGGIDLNSANMGMTITRDANGGVQVNFDPAMIERIKAQGVFSADPVIIRITPMSQAQISPLLGLQVPSQAQSVGV